MDDAQKHKRLTELTEEERRVTQEGGTETPFQNKYWNTHEAGEYRCKVCGTQLFSSDTKFDTHLPGLMGWPSFSEALPGTISFKDDYSLGTHRIEAVCAHCGSHLGHIFDDPESVSGKHYCINSCSLDFEKK